MEINNLDIAHMHWQLEAFRFETDRSVSAGVGSMREPDINRIKSYLEDFKNYKAYAMGREPKDLPHWADRRITLQELPLPQDGAENLNVRNIQYQCAMLDAELLRCQSKDLPSGMIVHDSNRVDKMIEGLEAYIADYIQQQPNPLDRPEHSAAEVAGR